MKFGILCNGYVFQRWQAETILHLIDHGIEPCLLIINDNPIPVQSRFQKWFHYPYNKLLARLYFRFIAHPSSKKLLDLSEELQGFQKIFCRTRQKGFSEYFNTEDIITIKSSKPDFLLRFGFDILKGEILNVATYGVWSFHHDDEQKYRGVPPGFWEIVKSDPVNGAILQRLTETLDGGIILRKGYFGTIAHSWSANIDQLYFGTTLWPLQVCIDIENGKASYTDNTPSSAQGKLHIMPGNFTMLLFLAQLAANKIRFHFRELFLCEIWNVGLVKTPVQSFLGPDAQRPDPFWLPVAGRGRYHADAFGFEKDGKINMLVEAYNYREQRGEISAISFETATLKAQPPKSILETGYHLAYPFLFQYKGAWYCMPETANNMSLDIYSYDPDTQSLTYLTSLLMGIAAVDATLCNHNGFWWLFFTKKGNTNTELHIWYSDKIFGTYRPHANNPVKTDIRSARPAGPLFEHENALYRPSQDCSRTYGGRVSINRIAELTPTAFDEEFVSNVTPFGLHKWKTGLHNLCAAGNFTIIDGKRHTFVMNAFLHQFKRKTLRIVRKNAIDLL
jgi:hypothetical protein